MITDSVETLEAVANAADIDTAAAVDTDMAAVGTNAAAVDMPEFLFPLDARRFLPIKFWDVQDRPREKFLSGNTQDMSNEELLAILIGSGSGLLSAVDIAQDMLAHFGGNLMELSCRSPKELARKFRGIGQTKAVTILAGIELGRRSFEIPVGEETLISSSQAAFQLLYADLASSPYERFIALLLAQSGKLIRKVLISEGGLTSTTVDAKKIFKFAIDEHACGIVLGHNHPSGNLKPSPEDINITHKLTEGARLLDLHVFDHLIVCGKSYYSFADHDLLGDRSRFDPYRLVVK